MLRKYISVWQTITSLSPSQEGLLISSIEQLSYDSFITEEQISALLSGRLVFEGIATIAGRALRNFFIHPNGFICNTSMDKAALDALQRYDVLQQQLKTKQLSWAEKLAAKKECAVLIKKVAQAQQELIFYYQVDYPEYFWQTTVEAKVNGHYYKVHRTPECRYVIYRDIKNIPYLEVSGPSELSAELFPGFEEYQNVHRLLDKLCMQRLEFDLLEKKYSILQLPALLKAVRKGTYSGDMDNLFALIDKHLSPDQTENEVVTDQDVYSENSKYYAQLYREMKYMLLASIGKYAEAKAFLQTLPEEKHHCFDRGLLAFYTGEMVLAKAIFRQQLEAEEPSIKLSAILNLTKTMLLLDQREAALVFLQEQRQKILHPSPKMFPVFYSQVYEYGRITYELDHHVYNVAELDKVKLLEADPAGILDLLAVHYPGPELYYNRERGLRNFYLALFGLNLKAVDGDLEKLKAAYIYYGYFGLHQLLCDFLRSAKYKKKLVGLV